MTHHRPSLITPVLLASCVIITFSFAIRGAFGIFQIPIAEDFGWPRAEFSMAIAIQNLFWGIGQPIFGALAEKIGDRKAIFLGAVLYAAGLTLSSFATTPLAMQSLEVLVGLGVAGTGLGVILAIVARSASDENRSMSLAIATAAGSLGQVIGAPTAEWLLSMMPWQGVFLVFAAAIASVVLALPFLGKPAMSTTELDEKMGVVVGRAFRDPSFAMIFIGFFSCGYQLGFIVAHFPALVTEMCGPIAAGSTLHAIGVTTTSALGAMAISVIGLANIVGTLTAGYLGKRYRKKYLLAGIYTARTIIGAAFILTPVTPASVLLFSVAMGSLWLATVPLTSGLVGHIFGLRYMGTLYGFVFLSHQLGSFLGVWLGGRLYDATGDYTLVWWLGIAVGALSALVHLPIREERRPIPVPA